MLDKKKFCSTLTKEIIYDLKYGIRVETVN